MPKRRITVFGSNQSQIYAVSVALIGHKTCTMALNTFGHGLWTDIRVAYPPFHLRRPRRYAGVVSVLLMPVMDFKPLLLNE